MKYKKIQLNIEASREKDGRYLQEISYCFDKKCSPKYKMNKKDALKLMLLCFEAGMKIKHRCYNKIKRKWIDE